MSILQKPTLVGGNVINLENTGEGTSWDVSGFSSGSIQVVVTSGAFSSGVLTVERSNDNTEWFAMATATTISSAGITSFDIDTNYIRVRVTTANGAAGQVRVSSNGRL
ncbi:MAG: hypothetical protein AAGB48_01870 [Planctomycetota bacterium]